MSLTTGGGITWHQVADGGLSSMPLTIECQVLHRFGSGVKLFFNLCWSVSASTAHPDHPGRGIPRSDALHEVFFHLFSLTMSSQLFQ